MRIFLTAFAALLIGGASAQGTSFPDVPPDSYAAEAVAELVELGILTGFPDGTFRGNEPFTRYQAALVVSRLLDVIEENVAAAGALSEEDLAAVNNAVQELSSEIDALEGRLTALEEATTGQAELADEVSALNSRVAALEEGATGVPEGVTNQLSTLEERIAALEAAQAEAPQAEFAALQEQVTALNQQVNELSAQLEAAQVPTPEAPTAEVPDVEEALEAAEAVAVTPERGKFYLGLGAFYELNERVRPRVKLGVDDVVAGFGLRATADYGRQTLIEAGSVALAGHLTYTVGVPAASAYLGLGGGYQFADLLFDTPIPANAYEGPFAGALLGAEFGTGPLTFFVEGTADYYLDDAALPENQPSFPYDRVYPTVAVGFNLRP